MTMTIPQREFFDAVLGVAESGSRVWLNTFGKQRLREVREVSCDHPVPKALMMKGYLRGKLGKLDDRGVRIYNYEVTDSGRQQRQADHEVHRAYSMMRDLTGSPLLRRALDVGTRPTKARSLLSTAPVLPFKRIFLDMDGVLANFVDAICSRHSRPNPWREDPSLTCEDLETIWGMGAEDFWRVSDHAMWVGLEKTPIADAVVRAAIEVVGEENVAVLTAPSYRCHGCVPGKVEWLKKHYPQLARRVVLTKSKYLVASPQVLLLDDFSKNVDAFREAGGHAILCPCIHNVRRGDLASFDPLVELKAFTSV